MGSAATFKPVYLSAAGNVKWQHLVQRDDTPPSAAAWINMDQ